MDALGELPWGGRGGSQGRGKERAFLLSIAALGKNIFILCWKSCIYLIINIQPSKSETIFLFCMMQSFLQMIVVIPITHIYGQGVIEHIHVAMNALCTRTPIWLMTNNQYLAPEVWEEICVREAVGVPPASVILFLWKLWIWKWISQTYRSWRKKSSKFG